MVNKMVWDEKTGKMVKLGTNKGEKAKVTVSAELAEKLTEFAKQDGYDFSGVSYETMKDAKGKTRKDSKGKPMFVQENGKPKKITVPVSKGKVNTAISDYVNVAIRLLIEKRKMASQATQEQK